MKKAFMFLLNFLITSMIMATAQGVNLFPVLDAYTTPAGEGYNAKGQALPRMADAETRLVLRFDTFFFVAENEDITPDVIEKAEVLIVSVLEGGLEGTSRRINDATVTVYECNNSWEIGALIPQPFELGEPIAGPIYYPGMGANDGTEEFMKNYETPLRIDITEFFKAKRATEFSIDFIKSSESPEFTRMGGITNATEAYRPRIEITVKGGGTSIAQINNENEVKVWCEAGNKVVASMPECSDGMTTYTLLSPSGQILESMQSNLPTISFDTKLQAGLYIVNIQTDNQAVSKKVYVNK